MSARRRRWSSAVCLVAACVVFSVGLLAFWAHGVVYDSATFADRSVSMLQEPAVRTELASRITEQLARAGNQNAVNFRPAFQLAVEAAIDTDTFRSIFRTAVYRTHVAVLASPDPGSDPSSSALNLSDSVSIIVANLSLPSNANPGQTESGGLDNSLGDVTRRLTDLHIWQLDDYATTVALGGLVLGPLLAAAAVALSDDRRRTLRRLGWGVLAAGAVLAAIVPISQFVAGSRVGDAALSRAVSAGVGRVMADLWTIGLWVGAYGLLLAAAARPTLHPRPTPVRVWARFRAWVERRRASTGGTVVLGAGALVTGALIAANAGQVLRWAVVVGGVWLSYFGVTELTRMVRLAPPVLDASGAVVPVRRGWSWRQVATAGGIAALVVLLLGIGAIVTTRRAATSAAAAGVPECNGDDALCDVPVNAAMFAGSHNAMSSALYPGWLFAEQTSTIKGQLDAGIRALLIDTHYGVPSTAKLPGSETPVIITDRAAELATPPGDSYDEAIATRAQQVAANAPPKAGAERDIYLCHNFCEMGAASFADQMAVFEQWLETHPDEVVIAVIEDHTRPDDTAAELQAAGLADRAWTLDPTAPMPTLGQMITAGRNLLVFAENGGPGSPAWYQSAYQWFQETPYTWTSVGEMNCAPNRGVATNKLMLVNHWVGYSPPDPGRAGSEVNTDEVLARRVQQCIDERGVFPNIVAVDFAERGSLVRTVARYNAAQKGIIAEVGASGRSPDAGSATPPSDSSASTTLPTATPSGPPQKTATVIVALTGGDPARFCDGVTPFVHTMAGWALADLAKPAAAGGLPALTYGPLAARQIAQLRPSTPDELAVQLRSAAEQSDRAVDALRQVGLTQADIDALADAAADQLSGANPDPAIVERHLVDAIEAKLGHDRTTALAASFDQQHPTPTDLFDLGDVSDAVAAASGYACLSTLGN